MHRVRQDRIKAFLDKVNASAVGKVNRFLDIGVKCYVPTPSDIALSIKKYESAIQQMKDAGVLALDMPEKRKQFYDFLVKDHLFLHDESIASLAIELENLIAKTIVSCTPQELIDYEKLFLLYNFDLHFAAIFELLLKDPALTRQALDRYPETPPFYVKL